MPDDPQRPPAGTPPPDRPTEPVPTPPPPPGYEQPGPVPPSSYGPPPPGDGQPGYGPPPGYGAPAGYGYGYPAGPQTESTATAALIIAIVGIFICMPVGAIVALVMANSAEKRIQASEGRLTGLELTRAARIISIVELVLTGVLILAGVLLVVLSLGPQ